jgi:SAM-dependent methyltransferase
MNDNAGTKQGDLSAVCPICKTQAGDPLFELDCGNSDGSTLYPIVRLLCCPTCHHCYNAITPDEIEGLINYYNVEYAPANLGVIDTSGDRPGSPGSLTTRRYDQLFESLAPYLQHDHSILDVGCAQGGFLDYLWNRGYRRLAGVDMTDPYIAKAREKQRYRIEKGSAESLPFDDGSFDVVVLEQVLEHLIDPVLAVREARRVLRSDGFFCIGVPDAARYGEYHFFDFYWLLLREHIQHFDLFHLDALVRQTGFELRGHRAMALAVMSDRMVMPNLSAVFQARAGCGTRVLWSEGVPSRKRMQEYIAIEKARLQEKRHRIETLRDSGRPVYVWGIGREFLYLYEAANLKACSIAGLIDANPFKRQTCRIRNMPVVDSSVLASAPSDAVLVIAARAHADAITKCAEGAGFKGEIFDL